MAEERMSLPLPPEQRKIMIYYLLNRAYPQKRNRTRGVGNREFYMELCDQPDNVLVSLYDSARKEEAERRDNHRSTRPTQSQ